MVKENEILRQVAKRDKAAFTELFQSLHRRVYFYALNMVREEYLAEEVTAETFAEVWRCAASFKGDSKPSTWILGIARNIALKQVRASRRHQDDDLESHFELSDEQGSGFVSRLEDANLVKRAMERLSWKHREIIELVFYEELSYEEIGKILNIPVNTVKTRVFYAKKALKAALASMGE